MALVKLSSRGLRALGDVVEGPRLLRVTDDADAPEALRARLGLLVGEGRSVVPGFGAYFTRVRGALEGVPGAWLLGRDQDYLGVGDVVRVEPNRGALVALYRAGAVTNSFLVTERCDNYCVMCSQPPKDRDDGWMVDELEAVIDLIDTSPAELGITGGEPALLGARLPALVARLRDALPETAVHILSNGRRFADAALAGALGAVRHPDCMVGVPLYADVEEVHDYVVQARGAFHETVRGILALKRHGVKVELRFVVQRDTVPRMAEFARFVARNLTFVDHVALMGLEPVGFARANLDAVWIDPVDYQAPLVQAVGWLTRAKMAVSLYNLPLCVLDPRLHGFARKSISDWKNLYFPACEPCTKREACGGFFASSTVRHTRGIAPFGV